MFRGPIRRWGFTPQRCASSRDRNGLILDIAAVLNALNAKVRSLNARSLPEGNALVYVTTEVPDLASLRLIMARIRTLGGVREIDRGNG